ncbi:SxtJ family membrane protein [Thiothrix nivea]|uniref:SxtJ n=1 Tax=Thiothrix nivea (strain ATCC 35100 / DSM 5205 / JP2) TaxID=870187 RepID=A0A656HHX8_THINJ|nr:hypothetical protein Thini_3471 [Thiothrix nivea DSM 5205]
MSQLPNRKTLGKTALRNFGLLTGGIFAVLFGLLFPWLGKYPIPVWPWVTMLIFWIPAIIYPESLQLVYKVWMKIGLTLGWVNTRVLLGVSYYLIIAPTGALMGLFKQGHIRQLATNKTGSLRQPSHARPRNHFERLF